MKKGTHYAKKLKQAYGKFRGAGESAPAGSNDPIEQMLLAALSQETTLQRAQKALAALREEMVDYNELRVSTPAEIAAIIAHHVPAPVQRAKTLTRLLNAVYQNEYNVSLDALAAKGVREVKAYLDQLDGITPYVSASVLLWSLGGHAIPVNDTTLEFLKKEDLVDADATGAEVQAFLERHISAADAKSFCLDLEVYASSRIGDNGRSRTSRPTSKTTGRKKSPATKAGAKTKSPTKKKTTAKRKK